MTKPRFAAFTLVLFHTDNSTDHRASIVTKASTGDLFGCKGQFTLDETTYIQHGTGQGQAQTRKAWYVRGRIGPTAAVEADTELAIEQQPARTIEENILSVMNRLCMNPPALRCILQFLEGCDVEQIQEEHDRCRPTKYLLMNGGVTTTLDSAGAEVATPPGAQLRADGSGVRLMSDGSGARLISRVTTPSVSTADLGNS